MIKKKHIYIIGLFLTLLTPLKKIKASFFSRPRKITQSIYATILGKKDASPKYKKLIKKALLDFEVNPSYVAIKQMNSVGPRIAGCPLASFTKYGIWINEEALATYSNEELEFQMYHEAAHYASKDHLKELISFTLLSIVATYPAYHTFAQSQGYKRIILTPTTLLSTSVGGYHLFTKLIRSFEKKADLAAAKKLCIRNKKDTVIKYIHLLQNQIDQGQNNDYNVWHPSIIEQEKYLSEFITQWEAINS